MTAFGIKPDVDASGVDAMTVQLLVALERVHMIPTHSGAWSLHQMTLRRLYGLLQPILLRVLTTMPMLDPWRRRALHTTSIPGV